LAVDGFEVDGLFEPCQQAKWFLDLAKPRMRHGNTTANPRRAKLFAALNFVRDRFCGQIEDSSCSGREFF